MYSLRPFKRKIRLTWAAVLLLLGLAMVGFTQPTGHVALLNVDGPIGPATTDYLTRTMARAIDQGAQLIVVTLNTPGGLDMATRDIIQSFLLSTVPVVTFVYPAGSRAASAGTYILYGSHIAAMSPASNLGSATPVQMGSSRVVSGAAEGAERAAEDTPSTAEQARDQTAMERKVINDSVAYIRGLAARHGRNADWAEQAIREAVNVSAHEAFELGVIDVVAHSIDSLLAQVEGRFVQMDTGPQIIVVEGLPVVSYDPDWRNELLSIITSPQIASILLLVGLYGLILEGYNPGALVPGVIGAISLLLGLYALQMLPVNYVGLGLMALGALLILAEAFVPSFGILGIGGVVALVLGSIMLIDTDALGFDMPYEIMGAVAAVSGLIVLYIMLSVGKVLRMKVVPSGQSLVGQQGTVKALLPSGYEVLVFGELWQAESKQNMTIGDAVQVVAQNGMLLSVVPRLEATPQQQLKET